MIFISILKASSIPCNLKFYFTFLINIAKKHTNQFSGHITHDILYRYSIDSFWLRPSNIAYICKVRKLSNTIQFANRWHVCSLVCRSGADDMKHLFKTRLTADSRPPTWLPWPLKDKTMQIMDVLRCIGLENGFGMVIKIGRYFYYNSGMAKRCYLQYKRNIRRDQRKMFNLKNESKPKYKQVFAEWNDHMNCTF